MLDLDHKQAAAMLKDAMAAHGLTIDSEFIPLSRSRNATGSNFSECLSHALAMRAALGDETLSRLRDIANNL